MNAELGARNLSGRRRGAECESQEGEARMGMSLRSLVSIMFLLIFLASTACAQQFPTVAGATAAATGLMRRCRCSGMAGLSRPGGHEISAGGCSSRRAGPTPRRCSVLAVCWCFSEPDFLQCFSTQGRRLAVGDPILQHRCHGSGRETRGGARRDSQARLCLLETSNRSAAPRRRSLPISRERIRPSSGGATGAGTGCVSVCMSGRPGLKRGSRLSRPAQRRIGLWWGTGRMPSVAIRGTASCCGRCRRRPAKPMGWRAVAHGGCCHRAGAR